jgi:hypothetical protein
MLDGRIVIVKIAYNCVGSWLFSGQILPSSGLCKSLCVVNFLCISDKSDYDFVRRPACISAYVSLNIHLREMFRIQFVEASERDIFMSDARSF